MKSNYTIDIKVLDLGKLAAKEILYLTPSADDSMICHLLHATTVTKQISQKVYVEPYINLDVA